MPMFDSNTRKNVVILLAGKFLEKILGFVAIIYYARVFSATELALVPLIALLGNLALVVFGFGILPTIVMETPRLLRVARQKALSLIRRVLLIGTAGAVLSGLVLLLFSGAINRWMPGLAGPSPSMGKWVAVAVVFQALFLLLSQALSGLSRFWPMSVASLVASILRLVLVIGLYREYGSTGIVAGLALSSAAGCLWALWSIRGELRENITESYPYRAIFKLSWPFYMESYVMYLRSQGDQLAVTSLLGAEALAFYYVARRLYDMLKVISDSIDSALIPALSRFSLKSRQEFAVWWHGFFCAGVALSVPMAFLAAACVPLYVAIVGWEKYQEAMLPAIVLCVAFIVDIMKGVVLNRTVFVLCMPVKRLQLTSLETIIMLPMLVAGALLLGPTGVALAYLFSGIVAGYLSYWILRKELDVHITLRDWIRVILPAALSMGGMLGIIKVTWVFCGTGLIWSTGLATFAGCVLFVLLYVNLASERTLLLIVETVASGKAMMIKGLISRFRFRWGGC